MSKVHSFVEGILQTLFLFSSNFYQAKHVTILYQVQWELIGKQMKGNQWSCWKRDGSAATIEDENANQEYYHFVEVAWQTCAVNACFVWSLDLGSHSIPIPKRSTILRESALLKILVTYLHGAVCQDARIRLSLISHAWAKHERTSFEYNVKEIILFYVSISIFK